MAMGLCSSNSHKESVLCRRLYQVKTVPVGFLHNATAVMSS